MADVFVAHLEWAGAADGPTRDPATFSRDLDVTVGTFTLPMSSAPGYRGDPSRMNPEQLFVVSLSACQALTYLLFAAKNGVRVAGYTDDAEGHLGIVDGRIRMSRVTLRPRITLEAGAEEARAGGEGARKLLHRQLRLDANRPRTDVCARRSPCGRTLTRFRVEASAGTGSAAMLIHQLPLDAAFAALRSAPTGLSGAEAGARRAEFGPN